MDAPVSAVGIDGDHLASLVEAAPDALLVVDERGDIVLVNAAMERMFGYDRSELVGRRWELILPPGVARSLGAGQAAFAADQTVRQIGEDRNLHGLRRDGTEFPIEVNYRRVRTGHGTETVASIRDVSRRQRAEAELRQALSLLSATLESTADGILVVSAAGEITGANERFAQMWGISDELLQSHDDARVMGFVLDQLVDADAFVAKVQALYGDPEAESNDVLTFNDGRIFERYSRPQRVGDEIVGRVWSFRDVTPRHRAQEQARRALAELSSADARFRALVESSDDPILSTTPEGEITSWNAAAERLFGYSPSEILGQPIDLLVADHDRSVTLGIRGLAMSEGSQRRSTEADCVRKDGTLVPISLTVSPIYEGETITGVSAIMRDITEARARQCELVEAQNAAVAASQAKSDFLATMSHEIRTPMNGVIGLTGLLLNTPLDDMQRRYAAGVRGAGEALLGIVDDILDFSKLEAGKVDLEEVDFAPRELVEEVGVLLADAASAQGLELIVHCDPSVPLTVSGDPGRLRQTLINLAGNAVKFTAAGEVVVSVSAMPRSAGASAGLVTLRFEVRDTGIGIDAGTLERLFEPFSQADASTTRRFGGTGLGLAISRRLVTAMGGNLAVDSEPGVGSTFSFSLRLPAPAGATHPAIDTSVLVGRRALVVDDNAANRQILVAQLADRGMDAAEAPDVDTALATLRHAAGAGTPYDVALIDLRMPDRDGLDLAAAVSDEPGLSDTRMMILTSGGSLDEARARSLGVGEWISKPVRHLELHEALVRLLEADDVSSPAGQDVVSPATASPGGSGRVLVAEDNPVNQLVALGVLRDLGYEVELVANGREALDRLGSESFDAVLMDCHMPELDGFDATKELRRLEGGGRRTPVIAMTAGVLDEDRERCLEAGMDDFVGKPVNVEHLRHTLGQWVNQGSPVTAPAPDGGRPGVLSRARLDALRQVGPSDGWGLLPTVVDAFLKGSREQLAQLRVAADGGDVETCREVAHSLRGAAANLGAESVVEACTAIERQVQAEATVPDEEQLTRLIGEVDAASEELRRLLGEAEED